MSRVILIRPQSSQGELTKTSLSQHPINLLYLAAYLIEHNHIVKVLDYEVEDFSMEEIINFKPDFIGITAMTPLIKTSAEIIKNMRREVDSTFIVGGNHVTAVPEETLREFPVFDIGVIGEGEEILREICDNKPLKQINGIVYRDNGKIVINEKTAEIENLDELPFPARQLIGMEKYKGASTPGISRDFLNITEIYINRGCNWGRCTFCASMLTHRRFRMRSIDNVIEEMKECIEKYKINHFTIDDDTLTTSKERTLEFCRKVKPLKVTWDCDSRVVIDKEILYAMKDSGCKKIAFGVESGSPRILKLIRKGININQIKNTFKWCKEIGIETSAFFIIGSHPDENSDDINETKKLIKEINPDFITASIAVPYPRTELRKQMEERKLILSNDWSQYALYNTVPCWRTTYFSPEELLKIQQKMVRDFYIRPYFVFRRLSKIRSWGELKYWSKAFFGIRKTMFEKII